MMYPLQIKHYITLLLFINQMVPWDSSLLSFMFVEDKLLKSYYNIVLSFKH